ncbi:hypothetical protein [Methylobacterium sp.]|uniref:hypothetical protein n=1 Tax=Methylobacterium sp. TaxID=409 RepID=UPI0034539889
MRRLTMIVALATAAGVTACAPNPIVARDPVPAPTPDIGYACDSRALPLNAFRTACEPVLRQPSVVVRAKG